MQKLTLRETTWIIAALHLLEEQPFEDRGDCYDGECCPLTDTQIDTLCQRLSAAKAVNLS